MTVHRPFNYAPPQEPLDIIYQDADVLLINKPAGLLSVPGRGAERQDSLLTRLHHQCPNTLLIHRLDCSTSGVMIFARNPAAQKYLGQQFEHRHVTKTYLAEVFGHPSEDTGTIDAAMRCDWENRPRQIIDPDQGKNAVTHWQVLERKAQSSLIRLTPITGRSHQLRVHMKFLGHVILGDELYADDIPYHMTDRLHLHAADITFSHPSKKENVTFQAPCPFYEV